MDQTQAELENKAAATMRVSRLVRLLDKGDLMSLTEYNTLLKAAGSTNEEQFACLYMQAAGCRTNEAIIRHHEEISDRARALYHDIKNQQWQAAEKSLGKLEGWISDHIQELEAEYNTAA